MSPYLVKPLTPLRREMAKDPGEIGARLETLLGGRPPDRSWLRVVFASIEIEDSAYRRAVKAINLLLEGRLYNDQIEDEIGVPVQRLVRYQTTLKRLVLEKEGKPLCCPCGIAVAAHRGRLFCRVRHPERFERARRSSAA